MRKLSFLFLLFVLAGCHERQSTLAPVEEIKWHSYLGRPATHTVRFGETIYAIAFRYDLDFRELITYNHLRKKVLQVGQVLKLPHHNSSMSWQSQPIVRPIGPKILPLQKLNRPQNHYQPPKSRSTTSWVWPAQGKIINNFNPQLGKKGIDIAGKRGGTVYAAFSGVVAYSGNGLSGYGNLIIIKHNGQFLTAYGNNLRNRVKEGQFVKAGQIIADMGIVERKFWGVHFEIRKAGQPVNPLVYLAQQ
ncbi:lipoprotein NlpD [Legionella beliardensis]|uniref:Lipoprotein NlpD n=1 Tax=Legionella beliardensis TaxID=91822 RepID=A0A378I9L8_9GAMM|nr:peptidoglycan DD-metalloendopeptidase family protein [Legionella beliardensis]STX29074.1 lipoprotein NlpD [Legionella beliardensis]